MKHHTFNINRLYQLIIRQAVLNFTPLLIGVGGIFGILLIVSIFTAQFSPNNMESISGFFMLIFFIAGLIFTSRVFSELSTPARSYSFLMLPASTLEKCIASWLLSSPVYIVVFSLFMGLIYLVTAAWAGISISITDIYHQSFFKTVGVFMVVQTIFFLGACAFRSYNFLKTLFSIFIAALILAFFTGVIAYMIFGELGHQNGQFSTELDTFGDSMITVAVPNFFWYGLGPFLLVVSYFKLKEREV